MYGRNRTIRRRGIIFTYDALMALFLLGLFIFGLYLYYYNESTNNVYVFLKGKKNNMLAHDIIITLEGMKYSYLPPNYQDLIQKTTKMDKELLANKSLSEVLVLLWNKGNYTLIKNLIEYLYGDVNHLNISIVTNSDNFLIYSNSNSSSDYISKAYSFVTGYEENKQPLGYVAKAFATKIKKNTTIVYPISPEGAGNRGGWLTVTKKFYYDGYKENVSSAILYLSLHQGSDASEFETLTINGNNIKNKVNWIWEESASTGKAVFGKVDIKPYIQHGWNTLIMRFRNTWFNAHIHPGSRIEITYQDDSFYENEKDIVKYNYYEDVYSEEQANRYTGAWSTMEYYIPLGANINNVTLHLNLKNIEDAGWWWSWDDWRWYNWDVRVYVNGNLIDEIDNPSSNMDLYYDITNLSQEGTNYVLVYANTYGNVFSGKDYTEIYSDPENDPYGSTYIFLNYSYDKNNLYYGKIDITRSSLLGGNKENPKTYSITFNNYPLLSTFLHVAQLFSYTIDVNVWNAYLSPTVVFSSHFPRGIPSTIYIDPTYFDISGNNNIKMEDTCYGCEYIPESSFEYTILIPSHVSYGNVFSTQQDAIQDAILRLKNVLGDFVNATEIRNETASIGNIPYLYGPVRLEVVVW